MTATEMFRKDHGIIRKTLVSLDRALLMRTPHWTLVAKNVATYLDLAMREYLGSEERWVLRPLAETGQDAAGVVQELEREHRDLEAGLATFMALTRQPVTDSVAPMVREKGVALVLEEAANHVLQIQEAGRALEEPAAID